MNILALALAASAFASDPNYIREVEQYRVSTEAKLKADDGWLTVVGLFRLKEGENRVGSGEANEITLPAPAPASLGTIVFSNGTATYRADGQPAHALTPNTDIIRSGPVSFFLIKRGDELLVRVKDHNSELRRTFTGQKWFPIDPSWKITAKFTPFDQPRTILFDSQNNVKQPMRNPGSATFTRDGKQYRLDPVWEGKRLFFIFRDATSNKSTYGAARFLYAEPGADGTVILDFNKAINPPCAFTPYATCPLPPPQNRLTLAITAGEKKYSDRIE
ncbi:MAG TPA: DUF1684 domain-containing protein [Bryobacteraceae bacterium]|nr:DUF1684 domain-containing protein [Bryobacteraceae bacterium]